MLKETFAESKSAEEAKNEEEIREVGETPIELSIGLAGISCLGVLRVCTINASSLMTNR